MPGGAKSWRHLSRRLLSEPVVHFLGIGALLFVIHRWVVGDPRTISVTPGLKAQLARHFQDLNSGRKPTPTEFATLLPQWQRA